MTRNEYMTQYTGKSREEQRALHRAYYAQFVNERTISYVVRVIGADRLLRARDEHLNNIPLGKWDAMVSSLPVAAPMKDFGDYYTLGNCVCIAKEAARQYIERHATEAQPIS